MSFDLLTACVDEIKMMAAMDTVLADWHAGVMAKLEEFEAAERDAVRSEMADEEVPEDASAVFERVRKRLEQGELTWLDVINGDSEDAEVREIHVWLTSRLDEMRQAFGVISEGMTPEQAEVAIRQTLGERYSSAENDVDREQRWG